jgi:hypothetical protein
MEMKEMSEEFLPPKECDPDSSIARLEHFAGSTPFFSVQKEVGCINTLFCDT